MSFVFRYTQIIFQWSVSQYCLHLSSSPLIHVLSMGQASHIYTLARLQFNLMRKHYFEKLLWYNDFCFTTSSAHGE